MLARSKMEDDLLIVPSGSPSSYCRLCFSESNVEPLILDCHGLQPNQPLLDLIRRHVAIRLDPANGALPCGICSTCRMMLEEFQRFRERCLKCDYVLTGEVREEGRDEEEEENDEKMCHQCRMAFSTISEMKTHFQVAHGLGLEQKYKCTICPLKFSNQKRLDLHKKIHETDKPFRCHLCTADFKTNGLLKRHRERWHDPSRVYECLHCPRVFANEVHLNLHTKSMHVPADQMGPLPELVPAKKAKLSEDVTPVVDAAPIVTVAAPTKSVATLQSNENKPFQCSTCFNRFHFVGSVKRHIREVHGRQALPEECKPLVPIHPAIMTQEPVPTITLPMDTNVYQVEEQIQPTDFYQAEPSELYPVEPTVIQPAMDTIVPNVAETPVETIAKQEQFEHYPGTTPFFIYLERLDENIIPPIANYEIPVGKFYFHTRQKKALLKNEPTELLEDDELAQLYPGFLQDQSRRIYPCDICGKELQTPEGLKRHATRHRTDFDYHCQKCGRGFSDKGSLDRHQHLHTNDFPYKCSDCPLGFVRPQLLAKHRERYHGPNAAKLQLYYCSYCPRAFQNRGGLNFHVKQQHPEHQEGDSAGASQMEVDEEQSLMMDESLMLDDKTAVFGMLL